MVRHARPEVQAFIDFFEQLQPADLPRLGQFYAAQAYFKDPFNEVEGIPAITAIFAHMFKAVQTPRFVVRAAVAEEAQCFLTWDFCFISRGKPMTVHGSSHLRFDAQGRVAWHRDYWDVAEELYEKLPVLGSLMRWLKRQASR